MCQAGFLFCLALRYFSGFGAVEGVDVAEFVDIVEFVDGVDIVAQTVFWADGLVKLVIQKVRNLTLVSQKMSNLSKPSFHSLH